MYGRLILLALFVVAFVMAAQLRGVVSFGTATGPAATWGYGVLVAGFVLVAAAVGGGLWRRKHPVPPSLAPDPSNRRQTYRIPYPEGERPRLVAPAPGAPASLVEGAEVLDVSEEGLRFRLRPGETVDETVEGRLVFPSGVEARVVGRVVRRDAGEVSLHLTRVVPPRVIVDEQRRLARRLRAGQSADPPAENGSDREG